MDSIEVCELLYSTKIGNFVFDFREERICETLRTCCIDDTCEYCRDDTSDECSEYNQSISDSMLFVDVHICICYRI